MRGGDGMSVAVGGLWVPQSDRVRRPPILGKAMDNCSAAIALIDRAYPTFQLRKVSLLQSRAAHKIASDDISGAFEDLEAAKAVFPNSKDEFYLRSLDVNTDLIRVYALIEAGRIGEAEAVARGIIARRPFVRTISAAIFYAFGDKGSQKFNDEILANIVKYHPNSTMDQFTYHFETGRFADALALYDSIAILRTVQQVEGGQREADQATENARVHAVAHRFMSMCKRAYALAAVQRNSEAEAAFKEAQDYLAQELTDPPTPPPDAKRQDILRAVTIQQANLSVRTQIQPIQTAWANLIQARVASNRGARSEAVSLLVDSESHLPGFAFTDAWRAVGQSSDNDPRPPLSDDYNARLLGLEARSLKDLFAVLLDAETAVRGAAKVSILERPFMSREAAERGGCAEKPPEGDIGHACFNGYDATLAVTEERALLRAASMSLADQKPYFVVTKRNDVRSSVIVTNYGVRGPEQQLGFTTTIEFEKRGSNENCTRCIDAAEVKRVLEPIYLTPASAQKAP